MERVGQQTTFSRKIVHSSKMLSKAIEQSSNKKLSMIIYHRAVQVYEKNQRTYHQNIRTIEYYVSSLKNRLCHHASNTMTICIFICSENNEENVLRKLEFLVLPWKNGLYHHAYNSMTVYIHL